MGADPWKVFRRIGGFEVFEEIIHARMRCLQVVCIRYVNARGAGGIEFWLLQIHRKDFGMIWWLEVLKELWMQECDALVQFPSRVCMLVALEELNFDLCKSLKNIGDALVEFPSGVSTLVVMEDLNLMDANS